MNLARASLATTLRLKDRFLLNVVARLALARLVDLQSPQHLSPSRILPATALNPILTRRSTPQLLCLHLLIHQQATHNCGNLRWSKFLFSPIIALTRAGGRIAFIPLF